MFKFFQYIFYPLMLVITVAASFLLIENMNQKQYIFIPGILLIVFVFIFILGEKYAPYRKDWQSNKGDLTTDFIQTFIVLPSASKLSELLIPILFYYPIVWMTSAVPFDFNNLIGEFGFLFSFAIALLCCEFFYYWFHRFCHKNHLLWRFHVVHHGAQRVYWINSGRFHLVEAFLSSMIYFLPLVFLGTGPEVIIMVITFSSITGFMEHINIDFKAGPLNYVFNTAELHRWHHSIQMNESNNNFGKALSIWDVLFRTFHLPSNKQVDRVGVDDANVPNGFVGQLTYPFKKKKIN